MPQSQPLSHDFTRSLGTPTGRELADELQRRGLDLYAARRAARHAVGRAVLLEGLSPATGTELQERLRALGGQVVMSHSAYAGAGAELDAVDVLLLGSVAQIE